MTTSSQPSAAATRCASHPTAAQSADASHSTHTRRASATTPASFRRTTISRAEIRPRGGSATRSGPVSATGRRRRIVRPLVSRGAEGRRLTARFGERTLAQAALSVARGGNEVDPEMRFPGVRADLRAFETLRRPRQSAPERPRGRSATLAQRTPGFKSTATSPAVLDGKQRLPRTAELHVRAQRRRASRRRRSRHHLSAVPEASNVAARFAASGANATSPACAVRTAQAALPAKSPATTQWSLSRGSRSCRHACNSCASSGEARR